jgi:putative redox protein
MTTIEVTLQSGMHFEAVGAEGISVPLDSAPQHGGVGAGVRPMELLLAGLGGCTGMDVISILRKKRQNVTAYRVEVSGVQAQEYPHVFTEISIRHVLAGHDLSDEAVRRAIELSEKKYCPAFAMLEKAAHITSSYEIHPAGASD